MGGPHYEFQLVRLYRLWSYLNADAAEIYANCECAVDRDGSDSEVQGGRLSGKKINDATRIALGAELFSTASQLN